MPENPKPEFVLFYLSNCKYCINFMSKLKTKPELLSKFNLVDVEKISNIPEEVSEVPCVYDGKQVYCGKNSFKWLNEKMSDFLLPANDSLNYSFLDGNEEQIFGNYSLINQMNGSSCIGDSPIKQGSMKGLEMTNTVIQDSKQNNNSLESLMASRDNDLKNYK